VLPYDFRISLSISENDFDRDCVESIDQFGEFCYLNNITPSNP
jgi:hypothetical protein